MDDAVGGERRAGTRVLAVTMEGMEQARLRPGRIARVVDLSAGGALIETDWRLLPGSRVEMQLGEPIVLFRIAGRILRCHVTLLGRERVRYRAAVMFEKQLPLWEEATRKPSGDE